MIVSMKSECSILRTIVGVLFGICIGVFSGNITEAASVPDEYIVWDRMPAEAPVQMQLQATMPVDLYVRPNGDVIADKLLAEVSAERISVAVFTHPSAHPVKVLKQTQTYKSQHSQKADGPILYPGTTVYLLMYTGEGTYLGWYEGELLWWLPGGISDFSQGQISSPWSARVMVELDEDVRQLPIRCHSDEMHQAVPVNRVRSCKSLLLYSIRYKHTDIQE